MLDLEPDIAHVCLHGGGSAGRLATGDGVDDVLMLGQDDLAEATLASTGVLPAMFPEQGGDRGHHLDENDVVGGFHDSAMEAKIGLDQQVFRIVLALVSVVVVGGAHRREIGIGAADGGQTRGGRFDHGAHFMHLQRRAELELHRAIDHAG